MRSISRRETLKIAAGAGLAAILSACGGETATAPTNQTKQSTSAAPPRAAILIPTSGAPLPTEDTTFRWVHSGPGPKGLFFKAYFASYQQAHPNISIQLDELPWPEINKLVPLGVQNSNAPDVFQIPQNLTGAQAVSQGWVHTLDDIIPNFEQWKSAFPSGSFVDGVHVFKGKTYTFPFISNKTYSNLLLYNVDYLARAGIDPQSKPMTWDEYRSAAKKLTLQGAGNYYGVIIEGGQTNRWGAIVAGLAQMAGASGGGGDGFAGDMNWKSGEYSYTTDQYLAAIELLLALKSDSSVFPGSLSLNALQARAQFPQGVAAMMLQGPWNIEGWKSTAPDFKFDLAGQPVPNTGTPLPLMYGITGGYFWAYSGSKLLDIAGDIFHYLGTEEGQATFVRISGGGEPATFPKANQVSGIDARVTRALQLFDRQLRRAPNPSVRNPGMELLNLERKTITPDFGTVVQGIYTGQLSDAKQAMQDLKDRTDRELERAIKAARAKGANVSRDDFVFPNWDPTRDYTNEDYAALR